MSKIILYQEDARRALERGMDILAEAVSVTLGPKGRNVSCLGVISVKHLSADHRISFCRGPGNGLTYYVVINKSQPVSSMYMLRNVMAILIIVLCVVVSSCIRGISFKHSHLASAAQHITSQQKLHTYLTSIRTKLWHSNETITFCYSPCTQ